MSKLDIGPVRCRPVCPFDPVDPDSGGIVVFPPKCLLDNPMCPDIDPPELVEKFIELEKTRIQLFEKKFKEYRER